MTNDEEKAEATIEEEATEEEQSSKSEEEESSEGESESSEEESSEEVTISIGDEETPSSNEAPGWVKQVRKDNRKLQQRVKHLESQLAETKPKLELGPKPKMSDYNFESDKYETALDEWHEKKRAVDAQAAQEQNAIKDQQKQWEQRVEVYKGKIDELGMPDYEEAEETVKSDLSTVQQSLIIQGADNPALVVYALGKNPNKVQELAKIKDPVKFSFAIAKLEGKIKMTKNKKAPAPDKPVSGSSGSVSSSKHLERLRAEAKKSGDYSKVVAYKRQMKEAEAK